MLDPRLLRSDLAAVGAALARRGFAFDAETFAALEAERKALQIETERLQAERNASAKAIGKAKAAGADIAPLLAAVEAGKGRLDQLAVQLQAVQSRLDDFLAHIPNLPDAEVPDGTSEADNREVHRWGEPRAFAFPVRDHVDLGENLGQLDFEAAVRITGARFAVLSGPLARLQRALTQFMLDLHTTEHGYREVYVPFLVNAQSLFGTGQLPKFAEDLFLLDTDPPWYLIPTAEVPVTNLARDQILAADQLPLKFVCHSPCFRSEAGSHGRDTRGLIRQHQFEKVELVQLLRPGESAAALETLRRHAEKVLELLNCPTAPWPCARATSGSPPPGPTTSRSGCRRSRPIAKFPRAAISAISRRAACKRAGAIPRPASRNCCTRSMAPDWRWAAHWSRCWKTTSRPTAASPFPPRCGPGSAAASASAKCEHMG